MKNPRRRCLIADDVRAWRELLSVWMEECGYETLAVADGVDAFAVLYDYAPSLVITDIEMPRSSGFELLNKIRHHRVEALRKVPVVVISSLCDQELASLVKTFGGTCALTKPLERGRIQMVVRCVERGESIIDQSLIDHEPLTLSDRGRVSPKLRRLADEAIEKQSHSDQ
jgi:CheY-like chemotaxis protein